MQDLIGFVLPPVIDIINKKIETSYWRFIASMGVCLLITLLVHPAYFDLITSGKFGELAGSLGIIFSEAQTTYKLYWEKSDIRDNMNLKP